MRAEPARQHKLLDLNTIDGQISQARHRRDNLPELATLTELAKERRALTEELVAADARLSDAQADQERLESDLVPARERLLRDQQRSESGEVTDPKALRGILGEIEHLTGRIAKLEDEELEVMQLLEDLTGERDAIAERRGKVDVQGRELLAKRDAAWAKIDEEQASNARERELTAGEVGEDLLDLYEKLRAKLGTGVGALVDGRCTGCRIEANAADLRRYTTAPADEVLRCEECSRILVRPAR